MSFPRVLEKRLGAKKHVRYFRAPFQEPRLIPQQEHALRACSLLVIPPPPLGQEALPGGDFDDLSQVNLSTWVEMVQDVVAGLLGLQPEISHGLFPLAQDLLVHLESATRVAFCCQCYQLGANCWCAGAPTTTTMSSFTSGTLWSEVPDTTPVRGFPTSSLLMGAL